MYRKSLYHQCSTVHYSALYRGIFSTARYSIEQCSTVQYYNTLHIVLYCTRQYRKGQNSTMYDCRIAVYLPTIQTMDWLVSHNSLSFCPTKNSFLMPQCECVPIRQSSDPHQLIGSDGFRSKQVSPLFRTVRPPFSSQSASTWGWTCTRTWSWRTFPGMRHY